MTVTVVPAGRDDIGDLFRLSECLHYDRMMHYPFLAFFVVRNEVIVRIIRIPADILLFPLDTQLMVQWEGRWSSDFFHCTARDVQKWLQDNDRAKFDRWSVYIEENKRFLQYTGVLDYEVPN